MKKYIKPSFEVNETEVCNMIAESLYINHEIEVDGSEALSKEDDSWDIWND